MFHNVGSGQVGCGRSPKHFEGMSQSLSFSQWRQKSVKCLGAFYYFSDFQVAYSLVKYWDCCFLCSVCLPSLALEVRFMTHLLKGRSPPPPAPCIWKVFARSPLQDRPLAAHQAPDVWLLCPCQFGGFHSSFFSSSCGLWLRGRLNHFLLFPVMWSILVKQYFW